MTKPLLLVAVGTDHHPFDRLVGWLDRWLEDGGRDRARCVVQHGTTAPPRHAEAHRLLDHGALQALMADATVVVSHGGPTTITESRRHGVAPIVVPRWGSLGEHVDDHQRRFAARLDAAGLVCAVDTEDDFRTALDRALGDPAAVRIEGAAVGTEGPAEAVRRFTELVDDVVSRRRPAKADGPTVLYIGGFGRSGSTLLERMLGQLPGVCAVGEVVHLWERGLVGDELCGCGEPFAGCPFWAEVGKVAFGGWEQVDREAVLHLRRAVDRTRYIPRLASPVMRPTHRRELQSYARYLDRLYAAIKQVSGAEVIVDSSKHASYAFLLRRCRVDVRVLHLVRDSLAVAHSWAKKVPRPETDQPAWMPVYSVPSSSLWWLLHNAMFDLLGLSRSPTMRLRYEDMLAAPRETVSSVAAFGGLALRPDALQGFHGPDLVDLAADHTVAGNPMRFKTGTLQLRRDDDWKSTMPRRARRSVAVLTWPLRRRYGYPR